MTQKAFIVFGDDFGKLVGPSRVLARMWDAFIVMISFHYAQRSSWKKLGEPFGRYKTWEGCIWSRQQER